MQLTIRVNGVLAQRMGRARFPVTLEKAPVTVEDLRAFLQQRHPDLAAELARVVAVSDGAHQAPGATLRDGQEIALLLPMAGG